MQVHLGTAICPCNQLFSLGLVSFPREVSWRGQACCLGSYSQRGPVYNLPRESLCFSRVRCPQMPHQKGVRGLNASPADFSTLQGLIPTLPSPAELPSAHISESLDGFPRVNQVALQLFITGLDLSFLRTEKPVTACFPAFQLPTFYCHFLLFGWVLEKSHQYCLSGVSEETGATYLSSIAVFNQTVPNICEQKVHTLSSLPFSVQCLDLMF